MRLAEFKMVDDTENKQMYFQLWQAGKISDTKIGEILGIDWEHERKQKMEDQLAEQKSQMATQAAIAKMQNSLSQRATQQAQGNQGPRSDDELIAQADQVVQEYTQYDSGTRRSRMDALQSEDYTLYCIVRERMQQAQQDQEQAARAQAKQGELTNVVPLLPPSHLATTR